MTTEHIVYKDIFDEDILNQLLVETQQLSPVEFELEKFTIEVEMGTVKIEAGRKKWELKL